MHHTQYEHQQNIVSMNLVLNKRSILANKKKNVVTMNIKYHNMCGVNNIIAMCNRFKLI